MKLISVQSRGNRLVKVYCKHSYYVHGFMFSNPFHDDEGWTSRVFWQKASTVEEALKAAAEWLEGART